MDGCVHFTGSVCGLGWSEVRVTLLVCTGRTRNVDTGVLAHAGQGLVVMGTANLQTLALEDDAVERHGLGRLIHRAELHRTRQEKRVEQLVLQRLRGCWQVM